MKTLLAVTCVALTIPFLAPGGAEPQQRQSPSNPANPIKLDECRLQLLDTRIMMVGASQTGVLEYVEPGEIGKEVVAGAVVARIRDNVIREKLKAARTRVKSDIEIRYAKASNDVAKDSFDQARKARGSYSKAALTNMELEQTKTQLQVEKAMNDRILQGLEQGELEAELQNYEMTTRISGEVTQVLKKSGESVRQGDDIMQIIDTSEIQAIGKLPVNQQKFVTRGTKVRIFLVTKSLDEAPLTEEAFPGTITFLDKKVSRVSQTFEVKATVKNKKDRNGNYILKQGMLSRMEIIIDQQPASFRSGSAPGRLRR